MNLAINLPESSAVKSYVELMKGIKLNEYLAKRYESKGRIPKSRVHILHAILFGNMVGIRSTRAIENACKHDIRFMWLIENIEPPSHTLIGKVIQELGDTLPKLFKAINDVIETKDPINREVLYIDGTKIEADANRYSFVWKKTVIKNRLKLYAKISKLIPEMNQLFEVEQRKHIKEQNRYSAKKLSRYVDKIESLIDEKAIELVYGKGKRKTPIQRLYDTLVEYRDKMIEYEHHLNIIGEGRNSYAKTDHDATFMHMKEDHMRNSQLKPGYNVQIGVSNEYIRFIDVFNHRNDHYTFIPFMEHYHDMYGEYPKYPVADAGYGRYDTYYYCQQNKMELFQKHNMWEKERTKAYQNDPFNRVNFKRDKKGNYICPNNRKMTYQTSTKSSYIESPHEIKVYKCVTCKRCKLKPQCTKSKTERTIHVNETLDAMRKEVRENLESPVGINLRVQRSIQVEGAFGVIKQDMEFRRFTRIGYQGVKNELYLIAIGFNLMKFHNKSHRLIQ